MSEAMLVIVHVAFYAAFPVAFAAAPLPLRHILLEVYAGAVLVVGGFLGALYSIPISDDIAVSAGSLAYGALILTAFIAVVVGQDARVVTNIIVVVVGINVFKYGSFALTARSVEDPELLHRIPIDSAVFESSLRSVVLGGLLIVVELLLLLALVEQVKRRTNPTFFASGYFALALLVILTLDGVLFPVLVFPFDDAMGSLISSGVRAKLVIGACYGVALVIFLGLHRATVRQFQVTPSGIRDLVFIPSREIFERLRRHESELVKSQSALAATEDREKRQREFTKAVTSIDRHDSTMTAITRELASALRGLHDRYSGHLGVVVVHEGVTISSFGASSRLREAAEHLLDEAVHDRPWLDNQRPDPVVLVPLHDDTGLKGVAEVGLTGTGSAADLERLDELQPVIVQLFTPTIDEIVDQWATRAPIRRILQDRAIETLFQPIVDLTTGKVSGYECLSRFERGISPEDRFSEAHRLGLGTELEILAIRTALRSAEMLPPDASIALNVSEATILSDDLARALGAAQREVILEISEHEPIEDYAAVREAVEALGVRVAVDDAGSGYASLQHIVQLLPASVKLDRTWIQGVEDDRPRQVMIEGVMRFAGEIDASVVAEGVERESEVAVLHDLGIRWGQGHLLGPPRPAEEFGGEPATGT